MDENLRVTLRGFSRENGDVELKGVSIRFSGENFAMFNAAVISSPVTGLEDLTRRIHAAADYYRARGVSWSVWACEDWFEGDLASVYPVAFGRSGLHFVLDLPGMVAPRLEPPSHPLPSLDYRAVAGPASRTVFAQMMSACFGIPAGVARAMYERDRLWNCGFRGWLGYAGESVITAAATVVAAGVAGVYSVGTLPQFEHRGCGEAIVRHALAKVREETGIEATVLESSTDGYGLYVRMGYEPVTRYVVWASD